MGDLTPEQLSSRLEGAQEALQQINSNPTRPSDDVLDQLAELRGQIDLCLNECREPTDEDQVLGELLLPVIQVVSTVGNQNVQVIDNWYPEYRQHVRLAVDGVNEDINTDNVFIDDAGTIHFPSGGLTSELVEGIVGAVAAKLKEHVVASPLPQEVLLERIRRANKN